MTYSPLSLNAWGPENVGLLVNTVYICGINEKQCILIYFSLISEYSFLPQMFLVNFKSFKRVFLPSPVLSN